MGVGYRPRTEIYRFRALVVFLAVLAAILLQIFLRRYAAFLSVLDLPLLVVIYFGISRRNPSSGLLLGLTVGVLQDLLSENYVGLYGMAKTVVGFVASSLSARIETDRPAPRLLLVFLFVHFHQFLYASVERLRPEGAADYLSLQVLEAALVNALVGMVVFHLLDRFRKST
ncbi:MAG: rod shape-determining protein MreD [Terriglobia bacterium]